jgi:hypothetical protein
MTPEEITELNRKFTIAMGMCWHEIGICKYDNMLELYESYCICGAGPYNSQHERGKGELFGLCNNPKWDNPHTIMQAIMGQNEWERFVEWHTSICYGTVGSGWSLGKIVSAEIIATPTLFKQAYLAFKEV